AQPPLGDLVELLRRHARPDRRREFLQHPRDQRIHPRELLDLCRRSKNDAHYFACRAPPGAASPLPACFTPLNFFITSKRNCEACVPSADATAETSASRTCSGVCSPSITRNVGRDL